MSDLCIIPDGAILIRDGIIEETGTTRRVENLAPARLAREIDAAGKVVMPAFVDADVALASPASGESGENDIRRMSRHRLESQAAALAADLVRYGVLTVGANTLSAPDLQNSCKALRLHQTMQSKPLRIRSVFSPPCECCIPDAPRETHTTDIWLPAIFRKKLASLVDIPVATALLGDSRALALAAAAIGYNIRIRVSGPVTPDILQLVQSAGAVALIGPVTENCGITRALADVGCVSVVLASRLLAGDCASKRSAIDDGVPVALASGYRHDGIASINPQFLVFMACRWLGMTVEEAIVAVTYNAACSLRVSHVTGSLEPGKSADICIMDVDDYRDLARRAGQHDVSVVMRAGKIVYRRPNTIVE